MRGPAREAVPAGEGTGRPRVAGTGDGRPLQRRERATVAAGDRRGKRVNLSFNAAEFALVEAAATAVDLAPGAWAAQTVVAVARGTVVPVAVDERERFRALAEARVAVNRIGTNLNQIAAAVNGAVAAGEDPSGAVALEQVSAVLARVEVAIHHLDAATVALVRGR